MEKKTNVPKLRFPEFEGEWVLKKLGELTTYVDYRGKTPEKSDYGIFLVTAKNIKQGYIDYDISKEYIPTESYEEVMRRGKPQLGDVLITTEAPLGNIASIDIEGIALAQRVIKLRGKKDVLQNLYLKHRLMSPQFQDEIDAKGSGTTAKGIKGSELHKIIISFPTFPEQTKIASFLTSVDDKLTQLKKKKSLLEEYKKGVMQKIFSQELRFKDDNGEDFSEWEEKTLGELDVYVSDGNYGELYPRSDQMVSQGIPFIRANNIKNLRLTMQDMKFIEPKHHELLKSGHLQTGDILVTTRGDIGMLAYVSEEFNNSNINAQICLLRVSSKLNSIYLLNFLSSRWGITQFKSMQTGSALKQLPKSNLIKVLIKFPSLSEQTKIANFLSAIDEKINHCSKQIERMEDWKKGLLQQMFC